MGERKDRFAPRHKLLYFKYYTFYRNNKKKVNKKHWVKDRVELFKITDKICEVIADNLIEREGGVVMDKLGYFCIWMTPMEKRRGSLLN